MKTSEVAIIVVACLVLAGGLGYFAISSFAPRAPQPPESVLSANGMSQIKAYPDLVVIYYNIDTNGSTAAIAGNKNAKISSDLTTALLKIGFGGDDIQTESYSLNPDYIYDYRTGKQTQVGFRAVHQVKLEVSIAHSVPRLTPIGDAIDAGINSGANINYINFELSIEKQNQYKTEALSMATADARSKAEAVASGLGRKIGRVSSVSTSDFNYMPWRAYDAITPSNAPVAKVEATNIQPSSQDVTAQVSVVYVIV